MPHHIRAVLPAYVGHVFIAMQYMYANRVYLAQIKIKIT